MLKPSELVELSDSGRFNEAPTNVVQPDGWTESDVNLIGQPVVIGNRDNGFVGVILRAKENPVQVFVAEKTWDDPYAAQKDVLDEALRRKISRNPR